VYPTESRGCVARAPRRAHSVARTIRYIRVFERLTDKALIVCRISTDNSSEHLNQRIAVPEVRNC
jgi:hypothetical protein